MRLVLASALVLWVGVTLVLAELRWFRRRSLTARLRPYVPGGAPATTDDAGLLSVESFRDVIGPIATAAGEAVSRLSGIDEPLTTRLARIHDDTDPTTFRLRQLGWAGAAATMAGALAAASTAPPALGLAGVAGGGALGFLVVEHRLGARSATWQEQTAQELPVVAEQLGMLVSAGYSLGAAIHRLAHRGAGAVGRDLQLVARRMRQGVGEVDALREWADLVAVDAAGRLVSLLALNREAGDLGRLVTEEARTIRAELHRGLLESIERRGQQVWIPVTVATLLPGALFLAVPFVQALRVFSGA
jgi:Flp pilus assembly protein TadB